MLFLCPIFGMPLAISMTMRIFILSLVLSIYSISSYAHKQFSLSSDLLYAYDKILNLELQEAERIIAKHKQAHPNNAMPYFIENYVDFITIFINEDEDEFNRLKKNKEWRLGNRRTRFG